MNTYEQPIPLIMIVDPDQISSYITELILLKDNLARRVQVVNSAEAALAALAKLCFNAGTPLEGCPDLILLEIALAGMDGFDFLQVLQDWGQLDFIRERVVVLSCSISKRDILRAEAYQVRRFLSKPLTVESFHALLQQQ